MDIEKYLNEALLEAEEAGRLGNFPVGCVLVSGDGEIIGRGGNRIETTKNLTSHAEVNAINDAGITVMSDYDTADNWLFSTLEPCAACTFFLTRSNVKHAVWALRDNNKGGIDDLLNTPKLGPDLRNIELIIEPIQACRQRSSQLIQDFYRKQGRHELADVFA